MRELCHESRFSYFSSNLSVFDMFARMNERDLDDDADVVRIVPGMKGEKKVGCGDMKSDWKNEEKEGEKRKERRKRKRGKE